MFSRAVKFGLGLLAAVTLTACADKPSIQRLPDINFAGERPIYLNVAQLEIDPQYQAPGRLPNYEHLMPVAPEDAVIRWAKERLRPVGRTGFARVVIKDAPVVQTQLHTDKGVKGMFKDELSERFDASLEVVVEILDERHMPIGSEVTARAARSKTLNEDVTVNERQRALFDITDTMVHDIDSQLDGLIRNYLSRWVSP